MTLVGMDHGPPGGRALHKVEINNAINSMQCGATQCHAMHAPTWCLGAFYSLFAMHLKSEPKNILSHAPYNSKVTGTILGIRSPGPPSRDVFLFPRVLLSPLLNHYKAPILDTINVFSLVRIKVFTKKHGYDILGGLASRQTPHVGPKWLKNCAGTGCFIGRCIRFHHCNQDINCYK